METFNDLGILIPSHKTSGNIKVVCPKCKERKGGVKDKDLSVNVGEGTWKCHSASCGWSGRLKNDYKPQMKQEYKRPTWKNNTELSDRLVSWFESRGIGQFTLKQMKVSEGLEYMPQVQKEVNTVQFNYFRNGELINVKYRDAQKNFKLVSGAELVMYNIDAIKNDFECIICEGEIDALSFYECGFHNVVSVPNGASTGNNNFAYIDNCIDYLDNKETIYIATDSDIAGVNLRNELIRRLGIERCKIVEICGLKCEKEKGKEEKECKDANEVLISHGKQAVIDLIKNAKELKVDGIFTADDVFGQMLHSFRHGKAKGTTTYIESLNTHWTWRTGEVNIWTGYNNEGKSNFLTQLAILKAINEDWKFAVFCPENYPISDYYDDLIHCYVGKSCDKSFYNCMGEFEYVKAAEFINDHFFVIDPENDYTIDTVIEKAKYLVKRKGIKSFIIDPYNQIEHQMEKGQREDLYISKFMSRLKRESIKMDISIHLVAHQLTPNFAGKDDYPQPDSYKIKGGGTFSDKADNVIVVWRPYRKSLPHDQTVKIIIAKIKKQRLVGVPGEIDLFYSREKNQYFEDIEKCLNKDFFNNSIKQIPKEPEFNWNDLSFENTVF